MQHIPTINQVLLPERWPDLPVEMTFSVFQDIQVCPRRWGLSNGYYPTIWEKNGYPARPNLAALEGTIQHEAMKDFVSALSRSGTADLHSQNTVAVLRDLGGFTALLKRHIEIELTKWVDNPRAARDLDRIRTRLLHRLPEMRERLQALLVRMSTLSVAATIAVTVPQSYSPLTTHPANENRRLAPGMHAEKWLKHRALGWKGKVDLISVAPDGATIIDFKTGEPKAEHELQLQLYALLWKHDTALNPTGEPCVRLILCYPNVVQEVPVWTEGASQTFQNELTVQVEDMKRFLAAGEPPARPSTNHCPFCPVRHLCRDFWQPDTQIRLRTEGGDSVFSHDLEVELRYRHNARDWDVDITSSIKAYETEHAILRFVEFSSDQLDIGDKLRLLSANASIPTATDDGHVGSLKPIFTLSTWSELYCDS